MKFSYSDFVEHPRWGHTPRYTDLEATAGEPGYRLTTYVSHGLIPGTAIEADLGRQTPATVPALYYFDLRRVCVDCGRQFIFYAEEQKHWYEELGFKLDSDCVRCVPCRKQVQGIARTRQQYEDLFHVPARTAIENLELAECCLTLLEASVFHRRQTEHVRALLNRLRDHEDPAIQPRYNELRARLTAVERAIGGDDGAPGK